jgi:hypothetical protein
MSIWALPTIYDLCGQHLELSSVTVYIARK